MSQTRNWPQRSFENTFSGRVAGVLFSKVLNSYADALTVGPMHNDALGEIKVRSNGIDASFTMLPPDKPGDGTVPEVSGAASASNAAFATKMTGYEHQGSYENPWVKDVTAYSVARIAQGNEGK